MKFFLILLVVFFYSFPLLAAYDISNDFNLGSDGYRSNQTTLGLTSIELWDLWFGYGYVKPEDNRPFSKSYSAGINFDVTKGFNVRGSYLTSPKVEDFSSSTWSLGFTCGTDTSLAFDYGRARDHYDIQTKASFIIYTNNRGRKRIFLIPARTFTETIQQTTISLRLAHTFSQAASIYLGFSDYNYEPDIEDDIRLVVARQSNYALFNLAPGLSGYPSISYETGMYYPFMKNFSLTFDYLRLALIQFAYNSNQTLDTVDDYYEPNEIMANSYTFGLSYRHNKQFSYRVNYNRYKEESTDPQNFYTLGLTFNF